MHVNINHASFPNWDGRDSTSAFTIKSAEKGDELTYIVGAPSNGADEGAKGEASPVHRAAIVPTLKRQRISNATFPLFSAVVLPFQTNSPVSPGGNSISA